VDAVVGDAVVVGGSGDRSAPSPTAVPTASSSAVAIAAYVATSHLARRTRNAA
jgi:hypothetical protein